MIIENRAWSRGSGLVLVPLVAIFAALSGGCRSSAETSGRVAEFRTEIEPCLDLDLSASLLELKGDLHVHGTVRAKGMRSRFHGRLQVVVRTAAGTEWARDHTSFRISRRFRGGAAPAEFDLSFDGIPPAGSVVLVRHLEEESTGAPAEDER